MAFVVAAGSVQAKDWCELIVPPPTPNPHPTVDYKVEVVPYADFNWWCQATDLPVGWFSGCASKVDDDHWIIFLRDDLADYEKECVLDHEKAHLPPVLWDHPLSFQVLDVDGSVHLKMGPRIRRAAHLKPWYFVSGRHGAKTQELAPK